MKTLPWSCLLALLALAAVAQADATPPITPAASGVLTAKQVAQDLTYFRDIWAPKDRSFTPEARKQMLAFIGQQITDARPMDKAALALILGQAAAFSGNDHTLDDLFLESGVFHSLPFSFWWFPEGAIVTRAHPDYRRLLGARIVSIDGMPIEQAESKVERYIPGIATHKRYMSTILLTRIEALRDIDIAKDGTARFEFVLTSGQHVQEQLGVAPTPDPAAETPAWRASMVPGKGPDPWPDVLDNLKQLPLYLQKPDELSWAILRNGSLLYIRSTGLSPYSDDPLAVQEKAYDMMDTVVKKDPLPRNVVVDLRYNEGGNFFNILALATELVKMTAPSGHIYVVTGQATNSAAIVFTALLKGGAPARTTITGEGISDHAWFWSEGSNLTAPASGLLLRYTDGYHDWAHGCSDVKRCYWPAVYHGVKAGSLQPDMPVALSFKDYAAGKDPVLDAILADLDKRTH